MLGRPSCALRVSNGGLTVLDPRHMSFRNFMRINQSKSQLFFLGAGVRLRAVGGVHWRVHAADGQAGPDRHQVRAAAMAVHLRLRRRRLQVCFFSFRFSVVSEVHKLPYLRDQGCDASSMQANLHSQIKMHTSCFAGPASAGWVWTSWRCTRSTGPPSPPTSGAMTPSCRRAPSRRSDAC